MSISPTPPQSGPRTWATLVQGSKMPAEGPLDVPIVGTLVPLAAPVVPNEVPPSEGSVEVPSSFKKKREHDREQQSYPDEMQVFVGNLPPNIEESELQQFFSKFGKILDVRINRTNQKAGSVKTPNYGFVTFDNPEIVKSILGQKPIYFNEHRFNVEEKRSPQRTGGVHRSGSGAGQGGRSNQQGGPTTDRSTGQGGQHSERRDGPRRDDNRPFRKSAPRIRK